MSGSEKMRVIRRASGGWLVLSPLKADLQIGVCAEEENEALAKYTETRAAWRALLISPHDQSAVGLGHGSDGLR